MNTETTSIECATGLVRHPTFAGACRFWLKLGFINLGEHVVLPNTGSVNRIGGIVAAAAFAGMVKWNWNIIPVVLGAGVLGVVYQAVFGV